MYATAAAMIATPKNPPTTPPTIAPTFVLLLEETTPGGATGAFVGGDVAGGRAGGLIPGLSGRMTFAAATSKASELVAVLKSAKLLRVWRGLGLETKQKDGAVEDKRFDFFNLFQVYIEQAYEIADMLGSSQVMLNAERLGFETSDSDDARIRHRFVCCCSHHTVCSQVSNKRHTFCTKGCSLDLRRGSDETSF